MFSNKAKAMTSEWDQANIECGMKGEDHSHTEKAGSGP